MNQITQPVGNSPHEGLLLRGLDGANPLGFLAALGVLRTVSATMLSERVTISWEEADCVWSARLLGIDVDARALADLIAGQLHIPFEAESNAEGERESAQKLFDDQRTSLKNAIDALKKRKLRGGDRQEAERNEIDPLRRKVSDARSAWLAALKKTVPSEELSLGKHLNATGEELRTALIPALDGAAIQRRETVDLLAAFGCDRCVTETGQMQATPFCFTTGSGHQYFLDTVRQLCGVVSADRIYAALTERCEPSDDKLSLRWDPIEDRRYAAMWSDPTASDNKAKTNWALNLLAYRGLQLLPSAPGRHGRLYTTGWNGDGTAWRWPIWAIPLSEPLVRSLLTCPTTAHSDRIAHECHAQGIAAIFECQRIQVGNPPLHKVNFGPARQLA